MRALAVFCVRNARCMYDKVNDIIWLSVWSTSVGDQHEFMYLIQALRCVVVGVKNTTANDTRCSWLLPYSLFNINSQIICGGFGVVYK